MFLRGLRWWSWRWGEGVLTGLPWWNCRAPGYGGGSVVFMMKRCGFMILRLVSVACLRFKGWFNYPIVLLKFCPSILSLIWAFDGIED